MNELFELLAQNISSSIVGTEIPGIESNQVDTSNSKVESFSWQDFETKFNESTQMVSVMVTNISGSVETMDITGKYKSFFGTTKCKGEATPEFRDWNFTFNVDVVNPHNDSCGIQLVADEDTMIVDSDELELNLKMYTSACRTLLNAFDVAAALKDFDINQIVHIFPSKIMELLTERLRKLIPTEGPVAICYHNTTMTADLLLLEMSVQFDIDTIEGMVDDGNESAFKVQVTTIDNSDVTEILIIFGFGVIGWLCGCACMYKLYRNMRDTNMNEQFRSNEIRWI